MDAAGMANFEKSQPRPLVGMRWYVDKRAVHVVRGLFLLGAKRCAALKSDLNCL